MHSSVLLRLADLGSHMRQLLPLASLQQPDIQPAGRRGEIDPLLTLALSASGYLTPMPALRPLKMLLRSPWPIGAGALAVATLGVERPRHR